MKIVLLVEGHTERETLRKFFQGWLKGKVEPLPAVSVVNTKGCDNHVKDCAQKASLYLNESDVLAVIGLLDLHGPTYPGHCATVDQKRAYLRDRLEKEVGSPNFRQHFAIHELEAWLLSDPDIFPAEVKKAVAKKNARPEALQGNDLPSKLLERLYLEKTKRDYKKRAHGAELFSKLDPDRAAAKCPALKALLDDLLAFAQAANA
ncbi:DUF4276 family protein [Solidesulfovibrio sp.]